MLRRMSKRYLYYCTSIENIFNIFFLYWISFDFCTVRIFSSWFCLSAICRSELWRRVEIVYNNEHFNTILTPLWLEIIRSKMKMPQRKSYDLNAIWQPKGIDELNEKVKVCWVWCMKKVNNLSLQKGFSILLRPICCVV